MYHNRNDPDKHSSYMDGIPVKISELYKPPKKITLPSGIANRQPIDNFEQYDFRLERSTAEKMAKLRELKKASVEKRKQRLASEDNKLEELKKAVAETNAKQNTDSCETPSQDSAQETESAAEKNGETASCMLTPVPVNQAHQQLINNFDPVKRGPINISDFESDSSPFDNMELKTLNDIAELASVLQPNNVSQASYQQNFNQDDHRLTIYNQGYDMKQSEDQRLSSQAMYNQQGYDRQQLTDDQRLTNQSMYNQPAYDMKPSTDDHQLTMYNQQGYDIKPSRPFIQQPPNILPSNGYRVNGLYNTSNVYNTSSVSWNHQPTVSYTSARTTPSVYGGGVASTAYRPGYSTSEFGAVYASQNSDYRPENVGYTSQNYLPQTSEYTSKPGEYASKYGNDYVVSQPTNTVSKMGSSSTSNYMLPTSSVSVTRITSGTSNTVTNSRSTSEYLPKLGATLEYAPTFPWTNYNYQQAHAYVGGQAKVNPIVQQTSGASVESRLSSDSGVTDLIRELKLDLDDRRESDSRKVVENERIIASNAAVENDKLKQKIVSKMAVAASPQLPNPINQLTTSCRQLVHRIAEMGFVEERVARAVHRLGDNETKVLEFLLQIQRLEEETGCTAERVEQALIANRYDSVESARYLEILQQLLDLGFVETKVTEALARHSNDRDKAIESLIS